MGHTLTLELPDDVYQSLVQTAKETGQQPEALAIQLLATATQTRVDDPVEPFIGAIDSHGSDWADHHDVYLGNSVRDTMHREKSEGQSDV